MRKRLFGEEHQEVASTLRHLASLYQSQGCHSEAEPLLAECLKMRKRLFGEENPDYGRADALYLESLQKNRAFGEKV